MLTHIGTFVLGTLFKRVITTGNICRAQKFCSRPMTRWSCFYEQPKAKKLQRAWIGNFRYGSPSTLCCCSSMPTYGLPLLPQSHLLLCAENDPVFLDTTSGSIFKMLHSGAHFCIVFILVHCLNGQPNWAKVFHFHLSLNLMSYSGNHWITIDPPLSYM